MFNRITQDIKDMTYRKLASIDVVTGHFIQENEKQANIMVRHLFPAAGALAGAPIGGFIGGTGNVLKALIKDKLIDGQNLTWDDYNDRARSGMIAGSLTGAGIGGLGGTGLMVLANPDNAKAIGNILRKMGDEIG